MADGLKKFINSRSTNNALKPLNLLQLVVQVVDTIFSKEHAIGIVHETLRGAKMDLRPESTSVVSWHRCICRER